MTNNPIEAVRARLDGGRKWHKGELGDVDGDGSVCVIGACQAVYWSGAKHDAYTDIRDTIAAVVLEQYRDRVRNVDLMTGGSPIPSFNDHDATTFADVEVVLDKASVAWDEAHQ
jgi:hypothetical protein